ncbi:MAG: M16 family metallopeptidase [Candidatus Omnitrophota bacterium]
MKKSSVILILLVLFGNFIMAANYDFSKIKQQISEFTLPNGLKFILLEDHSVPIASFVTYVNVGASDERIGIWGISHFLEHMAFKGTKEIGTKDYAAEKVILEKMDRVFDQICAEKDKLQPDTKKINTLQTELNQLGEQASQYVISNQFDSLLKENGAQNINAGTSMDSTVYYYSLPSNRIELWATMESQRFIEPVFREFYKERGVITEERRMSRENQPRGRLMEELQAIAFKNHPYHTTGIGPMSNIERITRPEMMAYFTANYTAKNMVIGVAGDVTLAQLKTVAEKYFSNLRSGQRNPRIFTVEPPQPGEKTMVIEDNESEPSVLIAYHCPSELDPDFTKLDVLEKILTSGRSSRLNKRMVVNEKSALYVFSSAGYPGSKYPNLFMFMTIPNRGATTTQLIDSIEDEIEKLKKEPVTEAELESAKTRTKMEFISSLETNMRLLQNLLEAEVIMGSWQKMFHQMERIDQIKASDIQALAQKYFTRSNRTIARMEKKEKKEEGSK